ncbi:hypothetical protein LTR70_004269 [Exophiala xenobiotica]|uniref:Uncharacterized protein n=1 Tax=Lithohypha guttulata TaxID=1690604 RepID=A0ABR0KDZ7_9EURO|nr:hypothetical protein LTR24_003764 [Lithohypha guttulata]KAK5321024.1 hypothetical protein LTR70_004269 [Exophiala xenobiotica]
MLKSEEDKVVEAPNKPLKTFNRGHIEEVQNLPPPLLNERDQDLVYFGSQFEDDVLVDEFFELEGWVFLESK